MHLQADKLIDYGGFGEFSCGGGTYPEKSFLIRDSVIGRVYVAKVINSDRSIKARTVALKKSHITKHVLNPMLRHEACALLILGGALWHF